MLTIICGEDVVASRAYLQEKIESYRKKNYEIVHLKPEELAELPTEHPEALSLFGLKKAYVIEGLNKTLKRGSSEKTLKLFERLGENELLIWEGGVSKRELKLQRAGVVKEFKPSDNIFKLLDACYPKNLKTFLIMLDELVNPQNELFLFIMLQRHVRNLILVASGTPPAALQSWQVGKLKSQASHWDQNLLSDFYDKLIKLEIGLKTGTNPQSLGKSLEILVCYYLR